MGFHQLLWHLDAPWLFTRDDNLNYNLPLIKAQTDIVLGFEIPRMVWGLGAGWDPFMSGQIGMFYLPYLLANIISTIIGAPFALLEVSLVLHQIILGFLVMLWAPGHLRSKILLAICLIFIPGAFLLGMNWHAYGTGHVWWVGAVLLLLRETNQEKPFGKFNSKLWLWATITLFYQSTHPQIFVWGGLFLIVWVLLMSPRPQWLRLLCLLALCALPVVPSLVYLKTIVMQSGGLQVRPDNVLLEMAAPVHVAFVGSLLGNLGELLPMTFFTPMPYLEAAGLFFQPATVLCLGYAIVKKRWGLFIFIAICYLFLGAQSFPWLGSLNLGPLNGFRWTFKLSVLTGPFFLLVFYNNLALNHRKLQPVLGIIGFCSVLICLQGRAFDLTTETYQQNTHTGELLNQSQQCLQEAQIPKGARLAFVGDYIKKPGAHSKSLLVLTGNATLLLNVGATHLYEHIEPDYLQDGHLRMAGRQSNPLNNELFAQQPKELTRALRYIGATHLFTSFPNILPAGPTTQCGDERGQQIYFQKIPAARPGGYPHLHDYSNSTPINIQDNGVLFVPTNGKEPPSLNTTASMSWSQESDGLLGYPNPLNPLWGIATALLALFVGFLFWRSRF